MFVKFPVAGSRQLHSPFFNGLINPVDHYLNYGAAEASSAEVPLVQTVPSEQRVSNDPNRSSVTGEIVPGNYNKPTPAPTSPDAKPGPVLKPADVGDKADPSVSPPVKVPAAPVPVPGDANYVAPPGGGILDTNTKPVVPPSSSTGNWAQVNPDGSADLIKPDGGSGGTLPPGSINPDAPVVPETPGGGESGGGSGGDDGGGGGGTPPVQAADRTVELSNTGGKQSLTLGTGNDTVTGVLPEHLEFVGLTGNGYIRGGQGMDTITLEAGKYDLLTGQLGSFETVNLKNTTQDFTWRIGSSDFLTGAFQRTAETSIKAEDLSGGNIWVDLPGIRKLALNLETAENNDNILLRLGHSKSVVNMNTKGGDDTLVLVGALDSTQSPKPTINDATGFTDIGKGAPNGSWFAGGKIDMGAGNNHLKVYGSAHLNHVDLEASGGTLGLELTGYRSEVTITHKQFTKLTADAKTILVTNPAGSVKNAASWLSIKGDSTKIIDMSQVSIASGAHVNFILQDGIEITNKPVVTGTGTWGYRIMGDVGATYEGISGSNEIFEIDQSALSGGRYTGNMSDSDTVTLRLKDNGTNTSTLILNDKGPDGHVNHFETLTITSARSGTSDVPTYKDSNVTFGIADGQTNFKNVTFSANSNDTLNIKNLAGTPSVNLGGGNDVLTGLNAGLFASGGSTLDGGKGFDKVTVAAMSADITVSTQLKNFEEVTFQSITQNVTWTLTDDNYRYSYMSGDSLVTETGLDPTINKSTVTVVASALKTGQLTFDASAITADTFGFNVTGGAAADTFTGSKGADTFTGGGGADKFVYSTLGKSLAAKHDTITDFVSGTDQIVVSSAQKSAIGTAAAADGTGFITVNGSSASGADIAANLTAALNTGGAKMAVNGAAVVKLGSDTYLVLNDGTAAFDATQDDVIKIESAGVGSVTVLSTDIISA